MSNYYSTSMPIARTSQILEIFMEDASTASTGKTGLGFGDVTILYTRQGVAAPVAVTEQNMTLGTWASGGWKLIDDSAYKGLYEFGIPDAALVNAPQPAEAPAYVDIHVTASDAFDTIMRVHLTQNVYHADVNLVLDDTNSQDEWIVKWFKNGVPLPSSDVTNPIIIIVDLAGTSLTTGASMTAINSNFFIYNATGTERLTAGQTAVVTVSATIDSSTRTYDRVVGRDST